MGSAKDIATIEVTPDGRATYRNRIVLTGADGAPERERMVEEASCDASQLLDAQRFVRLPPGCVFHEQGGNKTVFVCEHPPRVRMLEMSLSSTFSTWDSGGRTQMMTRLREAKICNQYGMTQEQFETACRDATREFALAFPYLVFLYRFVNGTFDRLHCFYRTNPISGPDDELFVANLPNCTDQGMVCLTQGSYMEDHFAFASGVTGSPVEQVFNVGVQFWGSRWMNAWCKAYFPDKQPPQCASPWEWELASREDSKFMLRIPWVKAPRTIRGAVDQILFGEDGHDRHNYRDALSGVSAPRDGYRELRERLQRAAQEEEREAAAVQKTGT